jgi:hypothetical protein
MATLLLELDFEVLCLDHGSPLSREPKHAISGLFERTSA